MPSSKDNIKALFINSRTRLIIFLTALAIIVMMVIGIVQLRSVGGGVGDSNISEVPGIESVPGSVNPTEQYAKLQEKQNVKKVRRAEALGVSAIPTIIRTEKFGEGNAPIGAGTGEGGVGFSTLSQAREGGSVQPWIDDLKTSNCSYNDLKYAVSQGATFDDLLFGCTCTQLRTHGYELEQLLSGCKCTQLKAAGFSARELKDNGFSVRQLRLCGFSACEMKGAGFSAQELKAGGYSDGELKGAGFSEDEINKASGLPGGLTNADVRKAGCQINELRELRRKGVSADVVRRLSGCSVAQLRSANYTLEELQASGFSAAQLKAGGFLIKTPELGEGFPKNCSQVELVKARAKGITAKEIRAKLGCSAIQMKMAGYTAKELKDAGYTAAELRNAGFSVKELREAGFDIQELKEAGFSAQEFKDAGFSAREMMAVGYTAKELKEIGYSPKSLKDAGFSATELLEAGFNQKQLQTAGFNTKEIIKAMIDSGYSAKQLREKGYSSKALKGAGFSVKELLEAGFTREQLKEVGFLDKDLGFDTQQRASQGAAVPEISSLIKDPAVRKAMLAQRQRQNQAQYEQEVKKIQAQMRVQAQRVITGWRPSEQAYVEGDKEKDTKSPVNGSNGQGTGVNSDKEDLMAPNMIKAGDILFAILETSINSDEPSPILAKIVQGKLKGARIIGTVTKPQNGQRVILKFDKMSIPNVNRTLSIDAVAIDLNTARTALSSKTDNHYLTRYGSLLASSFLEGIGSAVQSSGTTVDVTGGGAITVTQAQKSLKDNVITAFGKVGQRWGETVKEYVNKEPTVHVYSGTGLGLLFMRDVKVISH